MPENPYAVPPSGLENDTQSSRALRAPAICLGVLSVLAIAVAAFAVLAPYLAGGPPGGSPQIMMLYVGANGTILYAAIAMVRRSSFPAARLGAIIACIPFVSPFMILGIPFGVWALVRLIRNPVVRKKFKVQKSDIF